MVNIFLIGYMGAGKTTVGQKLAQILEQEWLDLDDYITLKYQKPSSQIIKEESLKTFREYEKITFFELIDKQNCIISLGGGTVTIPEVREYLSKQKAVFYLKTSTDILYQRILKDKRQVRPLAQKKSLIEFTTLFNERAKFYEVASSHIINANQTIAEIITDISVCL